MTLGDILAALAAIFIVGASWSAAILLVALAFPRPVTRAETALRDAPGRCAGVGSTMVLVCGLLATLLINVAPGPLKLLGALLLGGLSLLAALGSGAIVRLVAGRIDDLGSPLSPFGSLTRASVLYVSSGFLPILGWFILIPAALLFSVGCGFEALRQPKKSQAAMEVLA